VSERKGSLVKTNKMDEPLFDGRSQNCVPRAEHKRHTASSGCERRHGRKAWNGTREVLAALTEEVRESPSYKETKAEEVSRMADETVVLKMFCESRKEGRVSAETQRLKEQRSVHCAS